MARTIALDKSEIVSGKPLPFSVFDPGRKLLLAAKGQMVTDRMREALLRNGLMAVVDEESATSRSEDAPGTELRSPLQQLRLQYSRTAAFARSGFRVSRDERSENFSCRVVGIGEHRSLILTAPQREDRSFVAIGEGQTWLFRTFYATAAIRFAGIIHKVVFEPFPYFHVDVPAVVEMRHIRRMQRVAVCLDATLDLGTPLEAVIVDLSSTGLRLAVDASVVLHPAERYRVIFRVSVLGQSHELTVDATVARSLGAADSLHPQVHFHGLGLETRSELDRMILHAFVQGCVISELDGLSKVLAG
ncbi:MAG TPA: flagellar brake protein [Povalibacter sp.]|nr:flagellar brake protein [Povalibacter sp.]